MKDIKPLLMVLLSVGLVGTWIYHIYDKTIYSKQKTEVIIKDQALIAEAIRDSLQNFYSGTIRNLDYQLDSTRIHADSIRFDLDQKLSEINLLKNDISHILKNKNATRSDMVTAKNKIDELQEKVNELKDQNDSMEDEKIKLSTALDQLNIEVKGHEQNIRKLNKENRDMAEKINIASTFIVSELKFKAVNIRGDKEVETKYVKKTDKFVISFVLQNNIVDYENTEIGIIIMDAAGQVIQNPVWDSGKFSTKNEGVKSFTRKIKFDYVMGEQKTLAFEIDADKYEKGNYQIQIYHNGLLIARASHNLE